LTHVKKYESLLRPARLAVVHRRAFGRALSVETRKEMIELTFDATANPQQGRRTDRSGEQDRLCAGGISPTPKINEPNAGRGASKTLFVQMPLLTELVKCFLFWFYKYGAPTGLECRADLSHALENHWRVFGFIGGC
jgi:hypothetical protein